ncbi:MAG: hypothetical protein U9P71_03910 [Campylobacterota bacterium]|nr:hypothetical protein [Campylobacterota bacterium]
MGILFLKFGLGTKVAGAKTFAHAISKAGGQKVIASATAGMLAKRHIIDLFSKFFTEHSVNKYRKNLIAVVKIKLKEIQNSSLMKRAKAFGSMLLSIPLLYFFWTKVLTTAIQKIVYALVLPLFTLLWNFVTTGFNIVTFILKILMLNVFIDTLAQYSWGKKLLNFIDNVVELILKLFKLINSAFEFIGLSPKSWLIKPSLKFNAWLEDIVDKGLSYIIKLQNRRDRYVNAVEKISLKRYSYTQKREEKTVSFWKHTKKLFSQHILKKRDWREMRKHKEALKREKFNTSSRAKRKRNLNKKRERNPLLLPYRA